MADVTALPQLVGLVTGKPLPEVLRREEGQIHRYLRDRQPGLVVPRNEIGAAIRCVSEIYRLDAGRLSLP